MTKKIKLSEFEISELKAGRLITVRSVVKPAPSMLSEPYQFKEGGVMWYSGSGLMSCSHKCPFGGVGDELMATGGIKVQVKKVWCALKVGNKPVDWKSNPWYFYARLKVITEKKKR